MQKSELLTKLKANFNDSELREICLELEINYEDLSGTSRADKARELILYLERRQRLSELVEICHRLRPNTIWFSSHSTLLSSKEATHRQEAADGGSTKSFDVFLSHNSKDKPSVKRLGIALKERGISVWLDEWELAPGRTWLDALEQIITTCKSAVVCVGEDSIGPWEEPEMQALLRRFVNEKRFGNVVPIIPVLLPGAPLDVKLPIFLEAFTWVDLRGGLKRDKIDSLEWGITGRKPRL